MNEDKISISKTVKVGLADYGSADVQVSFTSALREGEDEDAAYERVGLFVDSRLEYEEKLLNAKADVSYGDGSEEISTKDPEPEKEDKKEKKEDKKTSGGSGLARLRGRKNSKVDDSDGGEDSNKEEEYNDEGAGSLETDKGESRDVGTESKEDKKPAKASKTKSARDSVLAKYKLSKKGKSSSLKR